MYQKDGTLIGTYTADENGYLSMGPLSPGEYYYIDVDDPTKTKVYFTVSDAGDVNTNQTNQSGKPAVIGTTVGQDKAPKDYTTILDETIPTSSDGTPKTGDNSNLKVLYITTILTGLALIIMVVLEVRSARKRRV